MAHVSPALRWLLAATLAMLAAACGSSNGDPKALPSWLAAYPGSTASLSGSNSTSKGLQREFVFQTKDPTEQILTFYERQLEQKGIRKEARGGGEYGGFLAAQDESRRRTVMVNIRPDQGVSQVSLTVIEAK